MGRPSGTRTAGGTAARLWLPQAHLAGLLREAEPGRRESDCPGIDREIQPRRKPDPGILGQIADESDGELLVRAAQLASGEDSHLEISPEAEPTRLSGS